MLSSGLCHLSSECSAVIFVIRDAVILRAFSVSVANHGSKWWMGLTRYRDEMCTGSWKMPSRIFSWKWINQFYEISADSLNPNGPSTNRKKTCKGPRNFIPTKLINLLQLHNGFQDRLSRDTRTRARRRWFIFRLNGFRGLTVSLAARSQWIQLRANN